MYIVWEKKLLATLLRQHVVSKIKSLAFIFLFISCYVILVNPSINFPNPLSYVGSWSKKNKKLYNCLKIYITISKAPLALTVGVPQAPVLKLVC